ncbi:unnamed protein product, partial [Onchocerca flexuosa]|uniref:Uncharacterized protein n=1 Tax=Onchocerca flexuosa TaxID=387005 RepID=A0A183H3T0_9BILA
MSSKRNDQNLSVTDDTLDGQHEAKDEKIGEERNYSGIADGATPKNYFTGICCFEEILINNMYKNNSSVSVKSLQSLDDDDFRNLLNTAAKPQYGSLQRKRK